MFKIQDGGQPSFKDFLKI